MPEYSLGLDELMSECFLAGDDNIHWCRAANAISEPFYKLLGKEVVNSTQDRTSGEIVETFTDMIGLIYNPISSIIPSIDCVYFATDDHQGINNPFYIVITQDIDIAPDPSDPSYKVQVEAGTYFSVIDDDSQPTVDYLSSVTLQEEQHLPEVVHKISSKYLEGGSSGSNIFTIQFIQDETSGSILSNKTVQEILDAYERNDAIFVNITNSEYPLMFSRPTHEQETTYSMNMLFIRQAAVPGNPPLLIWNPATAQSLDDYLTLPSIIT